MRSTTIFVTTLLMALTATAAMSNENDKLIITSELFPEEISVYTGKHDIVKIMAPANALNYYEENTTNSPVLFFVEADTNGNGATVPKGLYIMKNNVTTKLLDNGQDAAAAADDTKIVYLGATDGLYIYNATTNKAEKYGPLTDNIIGIAKENGTEDLYILTAAHEVCKVTDNGHKKDKLNIENARQIVLDLQDNLYILTANKEVYVLTDGSVKKIKGLPEALTYAQLLRPPSLIDYSVPFIANDKSYIVYANGTSSEINVIELRVKPSAYSMELPLTQYYAHDKKIYEYNILAIPGDLLSELKTFLKDYFIS